MTDNKRRIDACLRACAGISTQNLEDNVPVLELARRYNVVLRERDALRTKLTELEKQRDGLIGTMRTLAARPAVDEGRNNWEAIVWESICFAEEAIARTTGD